DGIRDFHVTGVQTCALPISLIFALGGLLIALPHPELWAGSAQAAKVFAFGMRHGGALHIVLGAAAMLAIGLRYLGAWRTLTFFRSEERRVGKERRTRR